MAARPRAEERQVAPRTEGHHGRGERGRTRSSASFFLNSEHLQLACARARRRERKKIDLMGGAERDDKWAQCVVEWIERD